MNDFEKLWRNKIIHNTKIVTNNKTKNEIKKIKDLNPISYSSKIINVLKGNTDDANIKEIFQLSACHLPHIKLEKAKSVYQETKSIIKARNQLEKEFIVDIKFYKGLDDKQLEYIIKNGWGLAGVYKEGKIIATKIPSQFHEYFETNNSLKKKYFYCHCPRVKKLLLNKDIDFDSIYCHCGGGFYKDVWEYITGTNVSIKILSNLFKGDNLCQFEIAFI